MQREIKFRAICMGLHPQWRKMIYDIEKFGYGREENWPERQGLDSKSNNPAIEDIFINYRDFACLLQTPAYVVMEYIGLKDKNGKEIYEGDVVKFRSHPNPQHIGQIKYNPENARFIIEYFANNLEKQRNYPSWQFFGGNVQCEILGNIYENPELLNNNIL